MTNDQTEIPIATPIASATNRPVETAMFALMVELPYRFGWPNCCIHYSAEVHVDERDQAWVHHTHEVDCEVWRYLP